MTDSTTQGDNPATPPQQASDREDELVSRDEEDSSENPTGDVPEASSGGAGGPGVPEDFDWKQLLPWEGTPTRLDKALLWSIAGLFVFFIVMLPLRPFVIGSNPVLLQLMTGSHAATGVAAGFARIGEIPLWVVVVAGVVGTVKFDFLFWWTGRQWGHKIVDMLAPTPRAKNLAARAQHLNPWWIRIAVMLSYLPGIPIALVFAIAGWTRMSLVSFLFFNTLGATMVTGGLAWLGYSLGQSAVDVALAIDNYALWISLALIVAIAMWPAIKASRAAAREEKEKQRHQRQDETVGVAAGDD
ncbi:VTT domain-containing protein [Spiractinospora alimapuensis]|uniref:DedA family protein n=1 Tax=Spiractinospora alimapuensis TaxID=2820884 RepID=UPI001F2D5078|nr:VTT domain-containing protein [Spiractinospora alimapuensis]QVQ51701.1 VTT domain-containing protein [Spiractinospora alimapuensis]